MISILWEGVIARIVGDLVAGCVAGVVAAGEVKWWV